MHIIEVFSHYYMFIYSYFIIYKSGQMYCFKRVNLGHFLPFL